MKSAAAGQNGDSPRELSPSLYARRTTTLREGRPAVGRKPPRDRATIAVPALLAQLVEHLHGKEGVDGSSPSEGSRKGQQTAFFVASMRGASLPEASETCPHNLSPISHEGSELGL